MRLIILVLMYVVLFEQNSFAKEGMFNPVATINTTTLEKGKFSLARAPLWNLNTTFLASSLNFGLFERFKIGTAPFNML